MIHNFFFDFDGTVGNTIEGITITLKKTKEVMGYTYDMAEAISLVGTPLIAMGEKLCGPDKAEEFTTSYRREYITWGADKISFFDGIQDLLVMLNEKNLHCAIVTSKMKDSLLNNLTQLNAHRYFDVLVTKESTKIFKPNPDPVEFALKSLHAEKNDAVMIGDTRFYILAVKAAGVKTIGVTWGFDPKHVIEEVKPDYIAETGTELIKICEGLAN